MERRALERYFKESRYQHEMCCLGIPNTKGFYVIISIEEAQALWKKIEERKSRNEWNSDLEECQDEEGNIYTKKTYSDLQRQGLL
ncbi:hypothetical protein SLA2020_096990 [Shorea laevis]